MYWNTVIWSDETEIQLFGRNAGRHVWRMKRTAYDSKNTIPTCMWSTGCGSTMYNDLGL